LTGEMPNPSLIGMFFFSLSRVHIYYLLCKTYTNQMQLPLFAGSRQQIAITTIRMTQTANSTGTPVSVRLCVSVSVGKEPLNFKFLLLVISAEESYFCNALLQKRPGASVCICNACDLNAQRSRVGGSRNAEESCWWV